MQLPHRRGSVHVRDLGKDGKTMIRFANLYLTLLHLAGAKRDTFGMRDPSLKDLDQTGPLSELLA